MIITYGQHVHMCHAGIMYTKHAETDISLHEIKQRNKHNGALIVVTARRVVGVDVSEKFKDGNKNPETTKSR